MYWFWTRKTSWGQVRRWEGRGSRVEGLVGVEEEEGGGGEEEEEEEVGDEFSFSCRCLLSACPAAYRHQARGLSFTPPIGRSSLLHTPSLPPSSTASSSHNPAFPANPPVIVLSLSTCARVRATWTRERWQATSYLGLRADRGMGRVATDNVPEVGWRR